MKICYVISTVNIAGGANRSLLDMIGLVKKAGHECVVLGPAKGSIEKELNRMNITYKVIPFRSSVKSANTVRNCLKQGMNHFARQAIKRFFKKEHFDLVHNNSLPTMVGMEAATSVNIPYVCHIRENVWNGLGMEFINNENVKKVIRDASADIAISEYILEDYTKFEPNGKYYVINDGININDYYEKKDILNKNVISIGMVGVINPQKGQEEAVRAIEILRERGYDQIKLEIIGMDGAWNGSRDYAYNLKKYVIDKNLDCVHFTPAVESSEELKNLRSEHDINLICSRAEGLGRTTIESMLSGSLTIAAEAGATPEILGNFKQGLLYECGNPSDLADKIEYVINHKAEMRTLAIKGQEYAVNHFSAENYVRSILGLYEEIIGNC